MPPPPLDPVLFSQHFVEPPYAGTLNTPQLIHRTSLWRRLTEAHVVHPANNLQTSVRIKCEPSLMQQAVRAGTARLTSGIEPHPRLANPYEKAANPRCQGNGGVGYPSSGFEHQASKPADWDMRARAVLVHNDECAIPNV